MSEKLDIFDNPIYDSSVMSKHLHTYKPYGSPTYGNSDEIRISVNFQDLILDIADSYLYIEGKFTHNDATKKCYLSNNAMAFLFDEIRYEMGGEQIAVVRKPGITTTLKTIVSVGEKSARNMISLGWGLSETRQEIFDDTTNVFSGRLPLKYLLGFAEDYSRGVLNVKQELILTIARTFENCYVGEEQCSINIEKLEWKIRHIVPDDREKLRLLSRINKGQNSARVKIAYRKWDLYELPSLRETPSDIWAIKTTSQLEKPRYIILGFQKVENSDNKAKDATLFTDAGIRDIRLYLNSEVYPYERWNLDFSKKLIAPAYYTYECFQETYYGRELNDPLMDIGEFFKNPVFVIDCNNQPEGIRSSTIDIKLEFEGNKKFDKNIRVYALILHDAFLTYNALDGSVRVGDKHF